LISLGVRGRPASAITSNIFKIRKFGGVESVIMMPFFTRNSRTKQKVTAKIP